MQDEETPDTTFKENNQRSPWTENGGRIAHEEPTEREAHRGNHTQTKPAVRQERKQTGDTLQRHPVGENGEQPSKTQNLIKAGNA